MSAQGKQRGAAASAALGCATIQTQISPPHVRIAAARIAPTPNSRVVFATPATVRRSRGFLEITLVVMVGPMSNPLTADEILGPEGRIAARLDHYEERPQQLEMARAVADAICSENHLIVEAGTGVGKSFAYLAPAILWATEPNTESRRVVISTHTISLQEQLLLKDIPLLNAVIPREFSSVLVKGRNNYLSQRRMESALVRSNSLFNDEAQLEELRSIRQWASGTHDGSRSDLRIRTTANVWGEVASDSGNCLGRACGSYDHCFYYQARRRVENAQIIVVNHALFFSDLALRQINVSILPDYDVVIFDEAHTLESVAGSHLGLTITSGQVEYTLNKLYNDRTHKGLLRHHGLKSEEHEVERCRVVAEHFFNSVLDWSEREENRTGRVRERFISHNQLSPVLNKLASMIGRHASSLTDPSERKDFESACDRLKSLSAGVDDWVKQLSDRNVYWTENAPARYGRRVSLNSAPVDVGPILREQLFQKTKTVIMASATMAVGDGDSPFEFQKTRLGITQCQTKKLGSPFDFRRQASLIVVRGMADPSRERPKHELQCLAMVKRYVERSDGRAFVLFTSYSMMRTVGQALTPWLAARDMALYSQADGTPRSQLLDKFKANPRGVLLGVDSFWQGVDVPGEALQNVIIAKLPFAVPDHPLLESRLEAIRETGGNPFAEYQLPQAVLKLRQGFGRLIRTNRDQGIVVILDPRIYSKPYGRVFINSLPECELIEESFEPDLGTANFDE